MTNNDVALLAEANRVNYRLRSTFFYRKLKEYATLLLPLEVDKLRSAASLYNWDNRNQWGIGEEAFHYIGNHAELHHLQVFSHPKLLREHPRLIAYYRNIAALSQKAVSYLTGINVKPLEVDTQNRASLGEARALALSKLFNEHITLIIDSSIQNFTKAELYGMLLASVGAQIDGSWRNAIGEEAENVVQRLLVNETRVRHLLAGLIPRTGTVIEPYSTELVDQQINNISRYRGLLLTNQTSMLFASDPDISLIDANSKTIGVIEVKGGADPAGALERYGAAKKSFEAARRLDPDVPTILVASCITAEVRLRIEHDPIISVFYNLTEILSEDSIANTTFMQFVFALFDV